MSVDEPEEEIYVPQKTRTRSAKVVQKFGFEAVNDSDEQVQNGDFDWWAQKIGGFVRVCSWYTGLCD